MKEIIIDNKKMIMKWLRIYFFVAILILITMAIWGGQNIYSLFQGPQSYEDLKISILQNENENDDLKHSYMQLDVDKITGSYAGFGKSNDPSTMKQVYYLMPLENASYFLTIIASEDDIPNFDAMEQLFYENIGKEDKTYQDVSHYEGGFKELNEEEKALAFDYFEGYDEKVQDVSQLSQYLCPYAYVIDEVGNVSISSLWTLFYGWIVLACMTLLIYILYVCNVGQFYLHKEIDALPEDVKDKLDDDYKNAEVKPYGKLGQLCYYQKTRFKIHVFYIDEIVWIYKKDVIEKEKRKFVTYGYLKNGMQLELWKCENQNETKAFQNDIFSKNPYILMGYQDFVYNLWKKDQSVFYEKLKELDILPKPKPIKEKKKEKLKEDTKKSITKVKDRKTVKQENEKKPKAGIKKIDKNETKEKVEEKDSKK